MKKIGFIGAYDKTDLIIYISRILVQEGLKVLIIDATTLQKTRYTVPCIEPSRYYITTYEDIDIAIGFETIQEIKNYTQNPDLDYDFILLDIDSNEEFEKYEMYSADKNYFVTAFDNYSLKKGLEIIGDSKEKMVLTKILFSAHMAPEEDEYLNFLSFYYSVKWEKEKIYFPFEVGDNTVIIRKPKECKNKLQRIKSRI